MTRESNESQKWYCKRCGKKTVHEINNYNTKSEFVTLKENIRAYQRCRECKEEGCGWGHNSFYEEDDWKIDTVEMDESDFDKLCRELEALRDFKEAVRKALDVTDRKFDTSGATVKTT